MATGPYMDALRGANFSSMPRNSTSGRRGNTGYGPGDFNPTVSFNQSGILPLSLDRNGLPQGTFNQMEMPSNTFVQVTYMVRRWKNGADAHILPGMLFFLRRDPAELKVGTRTIYCADIVTLGHLNQILTNAWLTFSQRLSRNDPTADRFFALMKNYGERELSHFAATKDDPHTRFDTIEYMAQPDKYKNLVIDEARSTRNPSYSELQELLDICTGDEMYALCASPAMIMNRMNFGGVTYNRTNDVTLDGVASLGKKKLPTKAPRSGAFVVIAFFKKNIFFQVSIFFFLMPKNSRANARVFVQNLPSSSLVSIQFPRTWPKCTTSFLKRQKWGRERICTCISIVVPSRRPRKNLPVTPLERLWPSPWPVSRKRVPSRPTRMWTWPVSPSRDS